MVSVWLADAATPPPEALAETVKVLSGASTPLSTALMITRPVLVVPPAAMVRVLFGPSSMSAAAAGLTGAATTVSVTSAPETRLRRAVTVVAFDVPLSSMRSDESASVATGGPSSSLTVTATDAAVSPA